MRRLPPHCERRRPLDASGVHPEAYSVVRRIIQAAKSDIRGLIGNVATLRQLAPQTFVDDVFGLRP